LGVMMGKKKISCIPLILKNQTSLSDKMYLKADNCEKLFSKYTGVQCIAK